MEGYNVLIPDVSRAATPEITLPVMDALQALDHTPVVMSMRSIIDMYRDMRYMRHGCYELFQFYLRDLFKKNKIDFAFSMGLGIIMEDSQKREHHNLAEECDIPTIVLLHMRSMEIAERLQQIGAREWKHTFLACTSKQLADLLNKQGFKHVVHWPVGTNFRVFFPADNIPENPAKPLKLDDPWLANDFDVCFAGTCTPKREMLLEALVKSGVKLALYGDAAWKENKVLSGSFRNSVSPIDGLNTVYNAAKIVLDLPHDKTLLADYHSSRIVDALAAGAFVLTHRRPALEQLVELDREVATFDGEEELVKLVRYYLDNELERAAIAQRGYHRVLAEGSWATRLSSLLPQLEMHLLTAA